MTNYIKKIIAALVFGTCVVTPALAWESEAMNSQIDQTNVLVNQGCSGTFLKKDTILTAAHCILNQYKTVEKEVIKDDGTVKKEKFQVVVPGTVSVNKYVGPSISQTTSYVFKVVKSDRTYDLALLKINTEVDITPAPVACDAVKRGDTVYAVGNAYALLYSSLTKGIVSNVNRSYRDFGLIGDLGNTTDDGENGLIQHSAIIAGGNSGGALYNDNGQLVGVNVRGAASGFSFSVPLNDIRSFLDNEIEDCHG